MKGWKRLAAVPALALCAGFGLLLWRSGFFEAAGSLEELRDYMARCTPYTQLVFFLLQLASVILAPIPSNLTAMAGAALLGPRTAFLLTVSAVLAGSMLVFGLARVLGRPFADRLVRGRLPARYLELIRRKRDVFLALVFLLPFFPDDLICILAGLTDIRPLRFLLVAALTRPWGLLAACALGGSMLSLPLWSMVLLGLAGAAVFLLVLKYGDRWERAFLKKFKH